MAVRGDEGDRKVCAQEQPDQHEEGEPGEQSLRHGDRADQGPQFDSVRTRARRAEHELEQRQRRRQPQGAEAGLRDQRTRSVLCMPSGPSTGGW